MPNCINLHARNGRKAYSLMRIIIAGAGEVGTHLAKMLSNDHHDIMVIDPEEKRLFPIDNTMDLMTVQGSATNIEVLKEVVKRKVDLFISVTHSEDTNVSSALMAKKLGAKKCIARIDNKESLFPGNVKFYKEMGIDYLIYPELIAAKEVVSLLQETGTTDFMDFSGGNLSLYVQKLEKNAPVLDHSLADIAKKNKNLNFRAVAIKREEKTIIPRGDDVFKEGDTVYVITTPPGADEMLRFSGKQNILVKNIMILGGSRIGKTIAKSLEKKYNIKIIDKDPAKCSFLADYLNNSLIINGDGREASLLEEEGLRKMDAFVAVTGNSETNILSCLLAKKMGIKKTIAEVENMEYIELAENSGLETIINKKLSAASRIFRFTASSHVSQIKCMIGSEAEVLEFIVPQGARITREKLRDIHFPKDAIVGGVIHQGSGHIANGDTHIQPNDRVAVFALPTAIPKIDKYFRV